jgi:hypothetical protein
MILNITAFGSSCWYPNPVKDGVLRECGSKLCVRKCVFWRVSYGVTVTVYQHWQPTLCDQFIETDIHRRLWK